MVVINTTGVPSYVPAFIWKFWSPEIDHQAAEPMVHVYDVYDNVLEDVGTRPSDCTVFHDLLPSVDATTKVELNAVEEAFVNLECEVEKTLSEIIPHLRANNNCKDAHVDRCAADGIRRYLLFLRFRNCEAYRALVCSVRNSVKDRSPDRAIYSVYHPLVVQLHLRIILRSILAFLTSKDNPLAKSNESYQYSSTSILRRFREAMDLCCWSLLKAEISIGVAKEEQEFILPETCYGTLVENYKENLDCCDLFFPILPTFALYVIGNETEVRDTSGSNCESETASILVGPECDIDIHLRNAMILNTYPKRLYFRSLGAMTRTLSCYDEFRWIPEHQDYSRLKLRCRQKFLQQGVTKTLVVKGTIALVDLTGQIQFLGNSPVGFGSFSDVWKGVWKDNVERCEKLVAVKCLRECMFRGVRDQLTKRLQAECIAWHRLCHHNVSQLYGLVQTSQSFGMVSPWCENGTIVEYIRKNAGVNKVKLLAQVASGMAYLHSCEPVVIHGDLKGGNILIDKRGYAVISDFGLSKVMEGMTDRIGQSFFAGSIRWMAPELIPTLTGDNVRDALVTTYTDVFAFAAVCLEVVTGQLPYHRYSNDIAVLIAVVRGDRPCRGVVKDTYIRDEDAFWALLGHCWSEVPKDRPFMQEILGFLQSAA